MTDTKYGILFTVELLHKYFVDTNCDDFSITPSQRTQSFMSGNKILAKQYDNKLYTGLTSDAADKPVDTLPANMQLTFFLQLNNPLFFNYTNLPFTWPSGKIYYFTNRNNNTAGTKNYLSQFLVYDNAKTYSPGDVVTDGAGAVFQSIKSGHGIDPSLANSDNWTMVDNNQYASEADALQWLPSVSTYNFSAQQIVASVDVYGYNIAAKDYTNNILSKKQGFLKPMLAFTLDLSMLQPGKYRLVVNGVEQWVYINDELTGRQVLAVVDIFNDSSIAAAYQFLKGTGEFASPEYSIYFLNRYTIWKYVLASGTAGTVTDPLGKYGFAPPSGGVVYSLKPIPLSEQALKFSLLVNSVPYAPIECASPQRLVKYKPAADTYSCSEIFINY